MMFDYFTEESVFEVKEYNESSANVSVKDGEPDAGAAGDMNKLPIIPLDNEDKPIRSLGIEIGYVVALSVTGFGVVATLIAVAVYCHKNRGESYTVNKK